MAEHTPGPWEYCEINTDRFDEHAGPYGSHEDCVKIGTKVIRLSCFVYPGSHEDATEWKANANLIAAAPEMYKVLKDLADEFGFTEWGSAEHAEEILHEIITRYYDRINTIIAKAEGKER